jgi:hypothetical protein
MDAGLVVARVIAKSDQKQGNESENIATSSFWTTFQFVLVEATGRELALGLYT